MNTDRRVFRISLATEDVQAFLGDCRTGDWYAVDTGERVMTEEGPDGEAVLLVGPSLRVEARHAAPLAR